MGTYFLYKLLLERNPQNNLNRLDVIDFKISQYFDRKEKENSRKIELENMKPEKALEKLNDLYKYKAEANGQKQRFDYFENLEDAVKFSQCGFFRGSCSEEKCRELTDVIRKSKKPT